jgi:protease-4
MEELKKERSGMNSKLKKSLLIWLAVMLVIVFAALVFNRFSSNFNGWLGGEQKQIATSPYIGVLYVEGTIMSAQTDTFGLPIGYQHKWTLNEIDTMIEDENNKGIVIFVDSPGGGVYESDELYLKIKAYKEKTGRPVYASMGSMAASGGYYISTAADKIMANRNAWTGSIGVTIGTFYDISGFLEKNGVKTVTITSGINKAMGSMVEPLTADQQGILQSLVDEAYEQFAGIVSTERKMDLAKVKKVADGRIYTAKQALALDLIDGIGTLDEAILDMQTSYDLKDCDVIDVTYQDDSILGRMLLSKIPNLPLGDTAAILQFADKNKRTPISYIFEW